MTIYWDVPGQRIVESTTNAAEVDSLVLYARDTIPVRLFLIQEDGAGGYETYEPSSGLTPILMGKPSTDLAGDARFGSNFGEQDDDGAWIGLLQMLDTTLLAEVEAAAGATYIMELTMYNESLNTDADTTQIDCTVKPDVHRAGDPLPSVTSPTGPWEYYIDSDGRKGLRLRNEDGTIVGEFIEP